MSFFEWLKKKIPWIGGRSPPEAERSPPANPEQAGARSPPDRWDLDQPLLYLTSQDAWSIRDACEGTAIIAATGGGKTSSSGATIAKAFLRAGFGGIVLTAKPEERLIWERYAQETGREKHLVIVSPEHKWRFNFLQYEAFREGRGGGLTENIVNLFSIATELAEGKVEHSGDSAFWSRAMQELLRNTVDILVLAGIPLALENFAKFIADAPQSMDEVQSEGWQTDSFCFQTIQRAEAAIKNPIAQRDFQTAVRYWLRTFPSMSDRTRAGIVATFTSVADLLMHGIARELFASDTNLVPDVTWKDGAIIVLDLPVQEFGEVGRISQGLFKTAWQKAVLRRDVKVHPRPVFLWADEASNFISSGGFDYQYQTVARSARACTTLLFQNLSTMYVRGGQHETHSFLGNLVTKIFHSQSDVATNQYAADLISQELTTSYSFNSGTNQTGMNSSTGGSETLRYKVLPAEFGTLRKGGVQNGLLVDAIIYQGGRIFRANGDTWIKTTFKQG